MAQGKIRSPAVSIRRSSARRGRGALLAAALLVPAVTFVTEPPTPAAAATGPSHFMLDNGVIRFGGSSGGTNGSTADVTTPSITESSMPAQPYYRAEDGRWFKLTFGSAPLSMTVGSGSGSNWTGSAVPTSTSYFDNGRLGLIKVDDLDVDVERWTEIRSASDVSAGHGTLIAEGRAVVNDQEFGIQHVIELGPTDSFVRISTRLTNIDPAPATNVHLWVGTRDDFVGTDDFPTKTRGNLVDGEFVPIDATTDVSDALRITSGSEGVLFYSTTPGVNTSHASCCDFSNTYNRAPSDAPIQSTGDGSYAMYLPVGDLAPGESREIVWFYAAGAISQLASVAEAVARAAAGTSDIEQRTATSGTILFAPSVTGQVHVLVVPAGSPAPTEEQIVAGLPYSGVTPTFASAPGGVPGVEGVEQEISVAGLSPLTAYDVHIVSSYDSTDEDGEAVTALSEISTVSFTTRANGPVGIVVTPVPEGVEVTFNSPDGLPADATVTLEYSLDGGDTWLPAPLPSEGEPLVISGLVNGEAVEVSVRLVVDGDPSEPSVATVVVPRASQTVTFAAPADRTFTTTPFTVTATASSGLPVAFSTLTPTVCTVSGSSVTLVGSGTCTLRAAQAGDTVTAPASAERSFGVTRAGQTLSLTTPAPRTYGDAAFTVTPTTTAAGVVPLLRSSTAQVCTVSGTTVTLVGAGTCTLVASHAGDGRYLPAASVTRSFPVERRTVRVAGTLRVEPRVYDGTTAATVGAGLRLEGVVPGDDVTLRPSAVLESPRAGGAVPVRLTSTSSLTGARAANYRLSLDGAPTATAVVSPRPLEVIGTSALGRPYDGSRTVALGGATLVGVLDGDRVTLSDATVGTAASSRVGTHRVTTAMTLAGPSAADYVLVQPSPSVTIAPRPVTITGATVTARPWDGTAAATVTGATLSGVLQGDRVTLSGAATGTFASSAPGEHAVTISPTLAGPDAADYTLGVPTLRGTIEPAPATLRITGGLVQFADGTPRILRAAVSPAEVGSIVVTYAGGAAPTAPGTYPVTVSLTSPTHTAAPLDAVLTVAPPEALLVPGLGAGGDVSEPAADPDAQAERIERLLARVAVRADGSLALPEIGPVLEEDGSAPALAPMEHRVLQDGEPTTARVVVVEERSVRVETDDDALSLELQAVVTTPEGRIALPVDPDGTLLLDAGGTVEVGGSGFLPGSTAEVWMFSTATFLGTAVVAADGTFEGVFPVDDALAPGSHTIQLNGIGADQRVRTASLGVRIDDPEAPVRERVVLATDTSAPRTLPLALAALAALLGAAVALLARRRREDGR